MVRTPLATSLAFSLVLSPALLGLFVLPATATTEQVLWNFEKACCGYSAGRVHFMSGNLFGTGAGQSGHSGQVFELINSGGTWTEKSPLIFKNTDGASPLAGLISDSSGVLFGTTFAGDAYNYGNVFTLYKHSGTWVHGTLWSFGSIPNDGAGPAGDLVMDSAGNIYGTAFAGGAYNDGTVFELTESSGSWSETILHSFGSGTDGQNPVAGLLIDSSGNLYGTAQLGGAYGYGVAFEMSESGGVWTETILHNFGKGSDGATPQGLLVEGGKGALYGTTGWGGTYGTGTAFELYLSGGVWKEKILHSFNGSSDGQLPIGGLRWSGTGALYGTTYYGGQYMNCSGVGCGVVFELTNSGGVWSETVLHSFGNGTDGSEPADQVTLDKSGNLYGTTEHGGTHGYGTVWEVTP